MTPSSRILICHDSPADTGLPPAVRELLGTLPASRIDDPEQLMPTLATTEFDLLLLSAEQLSPSRIALIQEIRARYPESRLPLMLITKESEPSLRKQALAAGACDCLAPPVDSEEIMLRIDKLLAVNRLFKAQRTTECRLEEEVKARTAKLDMLIKNGIMMSSERDRAKLLRQILVEGQALLNCDGATMYLLSEDKTLRFALRTRDDHLPRLELPLYDAISGEPNDHYVSTYVALNNSAVVIDDVYQETRFDLSGTRSFDQGSHYRTVSLLTVPMASANGEVLGVLQFINALSPEDGRIIPFGDDVLPLVEALAGQAAVALDNLQLLEAQESLMDNLFRVIGTAIDAKSPYTSRHCNRVPELAIMLAEAAHADTGPFANFRFESADEWREFKIGAWLHDCGKVTTPEFVIDKATKLETINNRIHEIRTRFEVLLRDAEIERLRNILNGVPVAEADARYAARKQQLTDDFSFVAACNNGAHTMSDQDIARLEGIAQTPWWRHFDDRLGASHAEIARYENDGEADLALPVQEALLADKPRHIIPRDPLQVPDPDYGFKLEIPSNLYNLGELYNLRIRRGTLTDEERYKINEHMLCTIMMLEQMRFPKNLKRVPEYAGTHHEAINGSGYPRRLAEGELSIPARIMAIADIFEALTAPDRPYKKPNTVSEAIRVLHALKNSRHIDGELFDLFLTSGLFRHYAEKFLNPEQIDTVDISAFIGPAAH